MPGWLASRFSLVGLIVIVLQQIPGIIWALRPPQDDPFARNSGTPLVEALEKGFGIATLLMLVVVPFSSPLPAGLATAFLIGAFVLLAVYYCLYVSYYLGHTGWPVLLGMAVLPPWCFLFTALYQGNWVAVVTSVVFGTVHVGLTYANLGPAAGRKRRTPLSL